MQLELLEREVKLERDRKAVILDRAIKMQDELDREREYKEML